MASSARIEELQKKFEENPRRYFAPLANEYRKAGEIEQAIAICREYLPQQPGHMSGHIVYGQALYEARQFEEAKTVFETALSLDPENLIALRHLGDIALIVGDTDNARAWYRRVLEADPRNEEIQSQLASLDQAASASAPTPAVLTATPSSLPTPSSVPTVVVSAVRPADAKQQAPIGATQPRQSPLEAKTEPIQMPASAAPGAPTAPSLVESLSTSPTSEVRLDIVKEAASPPPFELESSIPGAGTQTAPDLGAANLIGLETTSFSEPTPLPAAPTSVALEATAPVAESEPPIPATASSTTIPEPAAESPSAPLPFLDLSEATAPPDAASQATSASAPAPTPELLELDQPTANALPNSAERVSAQVPLLDLGEPTAPEPAPSSAPNSGPFVTETMAELYLQQGHREEALRVYRALLDQRPEDATLRDKVARLAAGTATSAVVPETKQHQAPPQAAPAIRPAQPPAPRAERARSGPTIREVLSVVAIRRPGSRATAVRGNGAPPTTAEPPAASAPSAPVALQSSPAAASPTPVQRDDAIAAIFGAPPISSADEDAARTLSFAFADGNDGGGDRGGAAQVAGAPAHPASDELSLDSVFGGEESARANPSNFSFDQFFSRRASTTQQEQPGPAPAGGAANADSPEEVAHFTQWLEGLKQR